MRCPEFIEGLNNAAFKILAGFFSLAYPKSMTNEVHESDNIDKMKRAQIFMRGLV
jgi:hypothetical protein